MLLICPRGGWGWGGVGVGGGVGGVEGLIAARALFHAGMAELAEQLWEGRHPHQAGLVAEQACDCLLQTSRQFCSISSQEATACLA